MGSHFAAIIRLPAGPRIDTLILCLRISSAIVFSLLGNTKMKSVTHSGKRLQVTEFQSASQYVARSSPTRLTLAQLCPALTDTDLPSNYGDVLLRASFAENFRKWFLTGKSFLLVVPRMSRYVVGISFRYWTVEESEEKHVLSSVCGMYCNWRPSVETPLTENWGPLDHQYISDSS